MSGFFDDASWVLIPEGIKEDVVYAQKPTDGLGDLTFTRASDATRTNSAGVIERTPWNLLQDSEMYSTAYWTKNASSISANVATAPNGTLTADRVLPNTTNTFHSISSPYSLNTASSKEVTLSAYLKSDGYNFGALIITSGAAFSNFYEGVFNLSNGTVENTGRSVGGYVGTSSIENAGNGWYRCTIKLSNAIANSTHGVLILPQQTNSPTTTYAGNGTSGVLIWGAQLVEGTDAKPYFATTNRQDVPRLDYRNADGSLNSCPRLLLEPQRTNLTLWSEDFTNVAYAKTGTTVSANTTNAPDGATSADSLVETTATGFHLISRSGFPSGTNTLSIYAKANTRNFIYVAIFNGTSDFGAYFNLSNGTIGTINLGVTAVIQPAGNGWYRCSVTYTSDAATVLSIGIAQANGTRTYTGDGTSGIYIWGAQFEAGAYPTTYIPTTTAAVTRLADAASKTGVSSLIGQTEGTMFADVELRNPADGIILQISSSSANRIGLFYRASTNDIQVFAVNSGTFSVTINVSRPAGRYKIAVGYKLNDFVFYINGTQVGTDNSSNVPACSVIDLGGYIGSFNLSNQVNQAALFPTRLTNAQLAQLTTL